MALRPSQSVAYWTTEFTLTPEETEYLYEHMVERERPVTDKELAELLVAYRLRKEEQRIKRELARGKVYHPRQEFAEGDSLVFPHMDFAVGTVTAKRPGQNPEHGDFDVITVEFEGGKKPRHFAAGLNTPHTLNRLGDEDGGLAGDSEDADVILQRHGPEIRSRLVEELERNSDPEFENLGPYWLPANQLADVHVGHLNIAEALIEVQNQPLPTNQLLPELDLPKEIPAAVAAFSLDLGLSRDSRFVDVGIENREWYLQRQLPEEATNIPRRLEYREDAYDRGQTGVALLQLEWELHDEWSEGTPQSVTASQLPSVQLTLTYPHRRSGTLPLSDQTKSFFPVRKGKHSMITFVDGRWGNRFPGWIVPEGRYVCGLGEWYDSHELPVGAYLLLERTNTPNEVVIDYRPRRMKREWVRMARVQDKELDFTLQKQAVQCEYDQEMIVAEADAKAIDELRRKLYNQNPTVYVLVDELAPKLMGLSTQGTVHAKTLYSGLNLIRRTPPGPIFAALATNPRFQEVGEGLFALARG